MFRIPFVATLRTLRTRTGLTALAVSVALMAAAFFSLPAQAGAATLISDKPDYSPGEVATFYGYGFWPGEEVVMQVLHADGTPNTGENHGTWVVTADADGHFETTWTVCGDDCLGSTLQATATGQSSGLTAQTTFTDKKAAAKKPAKKAPAKKAK